MEEIRQVNFGVSSKYGGDKANMLPADPRNMEEISPHHHLSSLEI
jgi:hypothetical protein